MKNLPKVLLLCFGLFAVGIGSTVGGWIIHRQSVPGGDVPNFSLWLVDAVGRVGPLLVSSDSNFGQRLGSVGPQRVREIVGGASREAADLQGSSRGQLEGRPADGRGLDGGR